MKMKMVTALYLKPPMKIIESRKLMRNAMDFVLLYFEICVLVRSSRSEMPCQGLGFAQVNQFVSQIIPLQKHDEASLGFRRIFLIKKLLGFYPILAFCCLWQSVTPVISKGFLWNWGLYKKIWPGPVFWPKIVSLFFPGQKFWLADE